MDYLFQDGGKPKKTKSKTSTKSKSTKTKSKTSTKTGTKTTKSKTSTKKGGNFLGTVGDLVAPTGWGPFATAAGLLALDRADSALRRGKSTKSSAKKGGMKKSMHSNLSNLSNEFGALKIRGNKPNEKKNLLDQLMKKKELEIQQKELNRLIEKEKEFGNFTNIPNIKSVPTFNPDDKYLNLKGVKAMKKYGIYGPM